MDETNMFIEPCQKVLEALISSNKEVMPESKTEEIPGLFRKKTIIKNYFPIYEELLNTLEEIRNFNRIMFKSDKHDLSFVMLWEYCEFVRWCEKMFLYENNSTQPLYSDTPIDSIDTRTLIINKKGFSIIINLKMSQKADFDNKSDKLIFHEIKEINIKRSYGMEIMNKFRIIDDNVKFNDMSDKLLLDLVNEIVFETISNHFSKIITDLNNSVFIGNPLFNNRFITP